MNIRKIEKEITKIYNINPTIISDIIITIINERNFSSNKNEYNITKKFLELIIKYNQPAS